MKDLESKNLWIQARVDELMDDEIWLSSAKKAWLLWTFVALKDFLISKATEQATREHAEIEAMTLNAQIDNLELK